MKGEKPEKSNYNRNGRSVELKERWNGNSETARMKAKNLKHILEDQ